MASKTKGVKEEGVKEEGVTAWKRSEGVEGCLRKGD